MNISNSVTNFLKHVRRDARRDPARDWLVLVIVSLIALAGIVVWNVWAFDIVARGGALSTPAKVAPSVSNRVSLDAIRAIFENRAAEQAKYSTGAYRYDDPSR